MSSAKLFRFSGIVLLLAVAVILVGVVVMLLFEPDTTAFAPLSAMQSPFWPLLGGLNFLSGVLLLIGLPGLYLPLAGRRGDVLGLVGTLLLGLGQCLEIGSSVFFIAIMPLLATKAPSLIPDTLVSPLMVFGLGSVLCFLLGPLLLGSALIRTRAYPVWIGVLFIMLGLCIPLEIIFSRGFASTIMTALTHVIFALALGSIGVRLLKQDRVRSEVDLRSYVVPSV